VNESRGAGTVLDHPPWTARLDGPRALHTRWGTQLRRVLGIRDDQPL